MLQRKGGQGGGSEEALLNSQVGSERRRLSLKISSLIEPEGVRTFRTFITVKVAGIIQGQRN